MELTRVYLLVILIVQLHAKINKSKSSGIGKKILNKSKSAGKEIFKTVFDRVKESVVEHLVEGGVGFIESQIAGSNTQAQSGEQSADPGPEITGPVEVGDALSQAHLKENPFTSKGAEARLTSGGVEHFSFSVVKDQSATVYALQADDSGVRGYWLPRDGAIDIPRTPTGSDPHYVFAPDFNGGAWSVSTGDKGMLRLKLTESVEGSPIKGEFTMQESFAYMHFSEGGWSLHVQDRKCYVDTPHLKGQKLVSLNIMDCDDQTIHLRDYSVINGANVKTLSLALFIIFAITNVCYIICFM